MNGYLIIFLSSCLLLICSGVCLWALSSSDKHTPDGAEQHGVKPSAMLYQFKVKIFNYSAVSVALLIIAILIVSVIELIGQ